MENEQNAGFVPMYPPTARNDPLATRCATPATYREGRSQVGDVSVVDPRLVHLQLGGGQHSALVVRPFNLEARFIGLECFVHEALESETDCTTHE